MWVEMFWDLVNVDMILKIITPASTKRLTVNHTSGPDRLVKQLTPQAFLKADSQPINPTYKCLTFCRLQLDRSLLEVKHLDSSVHYLCFFCSDDITFGQ